MLGRTVDLIKRAFPWRRRGHENTLLEELPQHLQVFTQLIAEQTVATRQVRDLLIEDQLQRLLALPRYQETNRLNRFEAQVYSQGGEDGILAEIFKRIGATNRTFVEVGAYNGLHGNTMFSLVQGWRGCWIEGSPTYTDAIRREFQAPLQTQQLTVQNSFVTAENIESVLREAGVPEEFDLLSIDIDGNDYWVWKALQQYKPRVVVIEYNALFPPPVRWVQKYEAAFAGDGTSHYGASLKSLELLGAAQGYRLVACTLGGVNAFFVRDDCAPEAFARPATAENLYEPQRYFLLRPPAYQPRFGEFETI